MAVEPVVYGASERPPRGDYTRARDDYTCAQNWASYTAADHDTYRRLYERQSALLPGLACQAFIEALPALGVRDRIPHFEEINERLKPATGWEIVAEYDDRKSGSTLNRPGLTAALLAAEATEYDVLLVYRFDRLARSLSGSVGILDRLVAAGVTFVSATEPQLGMADPTSRMMTGVIAAIADYERNVIVGRIKNTRWMKASQGHWVGGGVPLGYRLVDKLCVVCPDEAALVRAVFHKYVSEGLDKRVIPSR